MPGKKTIVAKTTFEEEQKMKDIAFLKLKPLGRLRIHEEMRTRIWGNQYNFAQRPKVIKRKLS